VTERYQSTSYSLKERLNLRRQLLKEVAEVGERTVYIVYYTAYG
jgi:hypothetical protein